MEKQNWSQIYDRAVEAFRQDKAKFLESCDNCNEIEYSIILEKQGVTIIRKNSTVAYTSFMNWDEE